MNDDRLLSSVQNPTIKQTRKLQQAKHRRSQQLFLLEGTHLIEAACAANYPLETLFYTPNWQQQYSQLWQQAVSRSRRSQPVDDRVLAAIATTANPDGVVATAIPQPPILPPFPFSGVGLALEAVSDPGNLGTIVRTAAAARVCGLWLSDNSVDLYAPKVLRASAGAWFRLPVAVEPDLGSLVQRCRRDNIQVVATLASGDRTYWDIDWCRPSLVLLGNEGRGLSPELVEMATHRVRIPVAEGTESLNVAIAAATIAYEALRQQVQSSSGGSI